MSFLTADQVERLTENGRTRNSLKGTGKAVDVEPVVKLILPGTPCVWLLAEIDPERSDWAYGLCDLGVGYPEIGTVLLSQLKALQGPKGHGVQSTPAWVATAPLSFYGCAARKAKRIVDLPEGSTH